MEFIGQVVGAKVDKTAIVEIRRLVVHPLYKKRMLKVKKFKVHDEIGLKVGDKVRIVSSRPISKNKYFKVAQVLTSKLHQAKSGTEK
ncbi:MAG TPA: 30S ribosomal protein S17 [Candidatus Nanoarchaeia archaeon]